MSASPFPTAGTFPVSLELHADSLAIQDLDLAITNYGAFTDVTVQVLPCAQPGSVGGAVGPSTPIRGGDPREYPYPYLAGTLSCFGGLVRIPFW